MVALLLVCAARFPGPLHTLEPDYTDHARHEYTAWAALQIGPGVWTQPLAQWDAQARHVHERWPTMPFSYPPAALLLFAPFGVASNTGLLPDAVVHVLMVALFGAAGVAAAVLLWRALQPAWPRALALLVVAVAGLELVRWGLNGFFDPLAVAVALAGIIALGRGRDGRALLLLAIACGLHYRLWFLGPLVLLAAWRHRRLDGATAVAGVVLATSAVVLVWLRPALAALPQAAEFVPNPLQPTTVPLLLGAILVATVWLTERDLVTTAVTALAVATAVLTPQWQSWYQLAYLPLLALPRSPQGQAALTAAWLALALQGPGALDVVAIARQLVASLG